MALHTHSLSKLRCMHQVRPAAEVRSRALRPILIRLPEVSEYAAPYSNTVRGLLGRLRTHLQPPTLTCFRGIFWHCSRLCCNMISQSQRKVPPYWFRVLVHESIPPAANVNMLEGHLMVLARCHAVHAISQHHHFGAHLAPIFQLHFCACTCAVRSRCMTSTVCRNSKQRSHPELCASHVVRCLRGAFTCTWS